ncbi:NAD-dependent epimerase/dehydratase family protein [Roseibium sediminicola]|uniref:NAD(P)-dependent oxidoreductase n=1 Tax=Roseibium sediminicola TaxID=2933272 RepID=A0ABT0GX06_9HYPH|nr:NAD(P)-dependent oxidoreductase [Roseibium sp. CAU 1639]MCK7613969.1 NAD(P)-dependent oxidoreductase [Roseibium sp. CAU 1639]
MKATVLGASGFIGGNLVRYLQDFGYEVSTPGRASLETLNGDLGRVFYCIGMTGNFRAQPLATVDAHAGLLGRLLERIDFDSFVFFSSTRIYGLAGDMAETSEDLPVKVLPSADTTYDLSKLLGEALCLSLRRPSVKVVRLSNVYGTGQSNATFLSSLLADLAASGTATIRESSNSSKDYVSIEDVVGLAEKIARSGRHQIYNVASGQPVFHLEIAKLAQDEGYRCSFAPGGAQRVFPQINIGRLQSEFGFKPRSLLEDLPSLLRAASSNAS